LIVCEGYIPRPALEGTEKGLFSEMKAAPIFIYCRKHFLSGSKKGKNKQFYAAFIRSGV
jgi:hypothetical protein